MDEEAEEGEGESSPRVLQSLLEMSEGVEGEEEEGDYLVWVAT